MNIDRINEFIAVEKNDISEFFKPFDTSIEVINFSLLKNSMSNTGYEVTTNKGRYFLKLYSNRTDKIETAAYTYLKDIVSVPELYYYDGTKQRFPFAYTITEYIDGVSFIDYVRKDLIYLPENALEIGRMCAAIHQRKYPHDGLLDGELNISMKLPYTQNKILDLLGGKPATHLRIETVENLRTFISDNPEPFDIIEAQSVLCHGDLGYRNIMISHGKMFLIDFEFAYSGSIYHDMGHLFRRKDTDVQALIGIDVYDAFAEGYNSLCKVALPADWLKMARLCDINSMLCLLNYDNVPVEWVDDIEADILYAISSF